MKTKDLIALLQEEDPTGETHVSIEGCDVWCVYGSPAYWDGALQVLERDENNSIVGAKYVRGGDKIVVRTLSISDVLLDYPDIEIGYDSEETKQYYEKYAESYRQENKSILRKVDYDEFCDWVFIKAQSIRPVRFSDVDTIRNAAKKFYDDAELDPRHILTSRLKTGSFSDARKEWFEENIHIDWNGYSRIIIERKEQNE